MARATALSSSPNITLAASIAEIDQPLAPLAEAAALLYASGLSTPVPLPASSLLSATSRVCDASLAALSGALGSRRARLSLRWCLRPSFRTLSSAVAGDPPGDSGAPAEDAAPRGSEANGPPDADGSVALIGESMAELRAGVWAMARALMAPRDWGEEESGPQGEISAQREAQWVTPEDRVSEKEAVALGLSILSQLSEYMFPLEDPSHAPSPSSPGRLGDVRLETDFWQCLRAAMASEDPLIRKRASHVLSLALPPPVQAGSRAWEAFLAVHGSLEDYGMHLVEQRWDSIAIVSPWMSRPLQSSVREPRGSGAADSGGVGHGGEKMVGGNAEGYGGHEGEAKERCLEGDALGSSQNVVARFEAVLSAEWALVLWKRALGHRNACKCAQAHGDYLEIDSQLALFSRPPFAGPNGSVCFFCCCWSLPALLSATSFLSSLSLLS